MTFRQQSREVLPMAETMVGVLVQGEERELSLREVIGKMRGQEERPDFLR